MNLKQAIMNIIGPIIGLSLGIVIITFFAAVTGLPSVVYFFTLGAGLVLGIGLFIINVYHNLLHARQVERFDYGECV